MQISFNWWNSHLNRKLNSHELHAFLYKIAQYNV